MTQEGRHEEGLSLPCLSSLGGWEATGGFEQGVTGPALRGDSSRLVGVTAEAGSPAGRPQGPDEK